MYVQGDIKPTFLNKVIPMAFSVSIQEIEKLKQILLQRSKPLELEMSETKVHIIVSSFWRKP